jgi:hypothetical protein
MLHPSERILHQAPLALAVPVSLVARCPPVNRAPSVLVVRRQMRRHRQLPHCLHEVIDIVGLTHAHRNCPLPFVDLQAAGSLLKRLALLVNHLWIWP